MGGNISFEVPDNTQTSDCFNIGFLGAGFDIIRVVQADEKILQVIREAILRSWKKGITSETAGKGVIDFKLSGSPFSLAHTSDGEIGMCRLCSAIIQDLLAVGWKLTVSLDMVKINTTQTWFFEHCDAISAQFCCINLASWNEVQLADFPENALAVVRNSLQTHLIDGIKKENPEDLPKDSTLSGMTFMLEGWVWTKNNISKELLANRKAVLSIIQELEQIGWQLYVSTNPQNCVTSVDNMYFINEPPKTLTDKFMVAFIDSDSLMLVEAPDKMAVLVRECIQSHWPDGIQDSGDIDGAAWFKMKGTPWRPGNKTADARRLLIEMVRKFRQNGYKVRTGIDITKCVRDCSTLLMENCEPADVPLCAISFSSSDRIRLFGGPQSIHDLFAHEVVPRWNILKGSAKVKVVNAPAFRGEPCSEVKCSGYPFGYVVQPDESRMRALLCWAFAQIREKLGWQVLFTVDVNAKWYYNHGDKTVRPLDTQTLILGPVEH